jgi:hypothetical protein
VLSWICAIVVASTSVRGPARSVAPGHGSSARSTARLASVCTLVGDTIDVAICCLAIGVALDSACAASAKGDAAPRIKEPGANPGPDSSTSRLACARRVSVSPNNQCSEDCVASAPTRSEEMSHSSAGFDTYSFYCEARHPFITSRASGLVLGDRARDITLSLNLGPDCRLASRGRARSGRE